MINGWRNCYLIAPSKAMVIVSLQNTLNYLLADNSPGAILAQFIQQRRDFEQTQEKQSAA